MTLLGYIAVLPIVATVLVSPEVNIDYTGTVDPYTGSPMEESETTQIQKVKLPDGSIYDREAHTFSYTVTDYQEEVSSSVANGMVVTESVSLGVPTDMEATLYCGGEAVTEVDYANIQEPGSYSLVVKGVDTDKQVLAFDIVNKKTGKLTSYTLPDGFVLQTVKIDDVLQAPNYSRIIDMQKEGAYSISYRCTSTGINYSLNVEIDHTLPEVQFDGLNGNIANGPVTVVGMQDGDRLKVLYNGEEVKAPSSGVFKAVGNYVVTVYDDADNSVTKEFTIRMYLNLQGGIFVGLAIAVFIAAGVYMYVSRKKLRVR